MTLEKFIESLANALDTERHRIKSGVVFFHGTPIPKQGVNLSPVGLVGDKWFTTHRDHAACYANKNDADHGDISSAAVFQVYISNDIFVAKQREGRDPVTGMGYWSSAVVQGINCGYGSSGFEIERKFIRSAIQLCFGSEAENVIGLYKPSCELDAPDELLLLDCDQWISNITLR